MISGYVDIWLSGQAHPRRGRLLAEAEADGSLPLLQIYDLTEYLLALKRHADGTVEYEDVWISDDQFDGKCMPVTPLPEEEIRDGLRRFFAGDPRAEAFVRASPLR